MARKIKLFLFCSLVFAVSVAVSIQRNHRWDFYNTLSWDSIGYYLYVPAVMVNDSLFEKLDTKSQPYDPDSWIFTDYPGTHKVFTKYTYGVALSEVPFFIISRAVYQWQHGSAPTNIYSPPDMLAIIVSDSFYLAAGLFLLGLALLRYFELRVVLITELILWLGTNLFMYSSMMVGFSHVPSFFLIAALIYLTPILYERQRHIHFFLAALMLGLLVLIRPTNIVFSLYILLYDVYDLRQLRARLQLLRASWMKVIWFPLLGFIVWIPQFMYWHYLSGHWLLYSYDREGFPYWYRPKMLQVLFHPLNGFFLYAPLMLLSMAGLYQILRRRMHSAPAILLVFVLTDYICGSWWYWNFGQAYGFRPYIDYMPMLAVPMAYFITGATSWSFRARSISMMVVVVLIFLSLRLQAIYDPPWQGQWWGWVKVYRVYKEALFLKNF